MNILLLEFESVEPAKTFITVTQRYWNGVGRGKTRLSLDFSDRFRDVCRRERRTTLIECWCARKTIPPGVPWYMSTTILGYKHPRHCVPRLLIIPLIFYTVGGYHNPRTIIPIIFCNGGYSFPESTRVPGVEIS